ncbi:MAG: VOC family protein [Pseudomonadota bacterium]
MITGVNHVTLAVADLGRSFEFYTDLLGLTPEARWDRGAYLSAGNLWLALIVVPKRTPSTAEDYSHIALSCDADQFDALRSRIETAGAAEWSKNRSEGASHYFLDPDGHRLEIHVGDLQTRLAEMRAKPWAEITFYQPIPDQEGETRNATSQGAAV